MAPLIDPEAAARVLAHWAREDRETARQAPRGVMAPEQAAAIEAALKRHFADDPAARDRLRRAYLAATNEHALMAAQGTIPPGSAAWMSAASAGFGCDPPPQVVAYFQHVVHRAIAEWERAMDDAEQEVVYEIGYLLDSGASAEKIAAVARSVSYPLARWHLDWIIAREKAWWVRLNAAIEEAEAVTHAA